MRFEIYISEGSDYQNQTRGREITKEQAKELLKKNCKHALLGYTKGNILYRGRKGSADYMDMKPSGIRTSANTTNEYTQLISHSKRWKDYPRRDKSFICSSSFSSAAGYGTVYAVFPFDGAKIGVAPSRDFWTSFHIKLTGDSLAGFNETLQLIMKTADIPFSDKSYSDMVKAFNKFDEKIRNGEVEFSKIFRGLSFKPLWLAGGYQKMNNLFELIENVLDPKNNRFKLVSVGGNYGDERECWTDSPCIFVRKALGYEKGGNPVSDILTEMGYNV